LIHYRSRSSRHPVARGIVRGLLPLTGLLVLLLAGCGTGGNNAPALARDQTFTFPYVNATAVHNPTDHVAVFDPAVVANFIDTSTVDMLYSGLVTLDSSTLTVIPDAASRWTIDATGTVYTFYLRPNLSFSDHTPITAADFAYSLDRALANNAGVCGIDDAATYGQDPSCFALGSSYLGMILGAAAKGNPTLSGTQSVNTHLIGPRKGLEVVDPRTLIIRLAHPAAYFLEALTDPVADPVEQSLIDRYHGGTWVDHLTNGGCSGPFMVKSYTPGTDLKLVPNPYWWGRGYGKSLTLTEVDRPFLASKDTEYSQYDKLGDYDYTDVPADDYTFAVGQGDFHQVPSLTTDFFGLNFKQPPFNNLDVRQAFDLSLNKQLLVDRVFDGGAIPTNHIVPEGNPGYYPGLVGPDGTESVTGNQQKALALLQSAQQDCRAEGDTQSYCPYIDQGASSLPIELVAGASSDASQKEIALIATQTWSQVLGLNVQVKDAGDLNGVEGVINPPDGFANPAQIWQIGWLADYPDPQDFLSLQFHTGAGNNLSQVDDPQLDTLMDRADSEQNATWRLADYHTIEQEIVNLCPWIPYAQERYPWRTRPWVQGFGLNNLLLMEDVDWPNVSILTH
jgi:oligopeptide transport system substrate-binding protein